ncbi:hypothetical protein PFISCL1PPCAC_15068, partial [Pristionchus fissidentatus]
RRGSIERENSTVDTQETERTPSTTNVLAGEKHTKKKDNAALLVYLRTFLYMCYALLIFIVVWMPTLIKPRPTERHEFQLGMIQSPSLFCSEFGRHLMLNYRFEMGVEEVAAGVQLCLRYAHPHLCRFRENEVLRTAPKESTQWGGTWESLVNTGPTANAIAQDGLAHWFWRWTGDEEQVGDHWKRTEYGLMVKEALEWWTLGHQAIPVSPSLDRAINQKSSFLRHLRQTDYLVDQRRRVVMGDLFNFPNDIYPMKPETDAPGGKLLMRFKTSNISRMGFPDPKGVHRDFKMCKYNAMTEATADLIQIFMTTFAQDFDYVGEHNFSPSYLKGLLKMEESILAKWMNWDYVDPERFRKILNPEDLKIMDDPYMKDKETNKGGYILAERGSEANSWRSLSGEGNEYTLSMR